MDEWIDAIEVARKALETAGFKRNPHKTAYNPDWLRDTGGDSYDVVDVYKNVSMDGGEFKLTLYGDLKDLPTLLTAADLYQALKVISEQLALARSADLGTGALECIQAAHEAARLALLKAHGQAG